MSACAYVTVPGIGRVELGPWIDNEHNLVVATWAQAYRLEPSGSLRFKRMPKSAYFSWQRERIDRVLARTPLVLVARDAECSALAYGYAVAERVGKSAVVHWVHCKEGYRRKGIGNALLAELLLRLGQGATEVLYTHRTRFDDKASALGMRHVDLERVLRTERDVA
jgi:hypothetical protein